MARPTAAEQLFTDDITVRRGETTPQGEAHHSSREFNKELRKAQKEGESRNVLELGRRGPLGVDTAMRDRLLLKFPAPQRDRIRTLIDAQNQYTQRGYESLSDAAKASNRARVMLGLEQTGVNGYMALPPNDQEEVANDLLKSKEYRLTYNSRLKEVATRDINPTTTEISDRVASLAANNMLDDRDIDARANSKIAGRAIPPADIVARMAVLVANGWDPADPDTAVQAQQDVALRLARGELRTEDQNAINTRSGEIIAAGTLDPAAVNARATEIETATGVARANAEDQARQELAGRQATQELLDGRARRILIEDKQAELWNDLSTESIHAYTVNQIQTNYDERADNVNRESLGNAVCDKKLAELRNRIKTYRPDAYAPGGAAQVDFQNFLDNGGKYLFQVNPMNTDSVADPEGWQMIMDNPELRKKFEAEAALELSMARLRVKRPPMTDADINRMVSSTAWGATPIERIQTIDQIFHTHQMFKDLRTAGREGGMLDRPQWDKVKDAVRKTKNPAIAGAIIAGVLAAMTGGLSIPAVGGALLMSRLLWMYGRRQYDNDFTYNADSRVYEGPGGR